MKFVAIDEKVLEGLSFCDFSSECSRINVQVNRFEERKKVDLNG